MNKSRDDALASEGLSFGIAKSRRKNFPKIICLCGSTRFTEVMLIHQWELTKQGFVVLSWCALPDSYFKGKDKHHIGDQEGVKEVVDEVHLRKIDLADEVMILNVGGYIGESTQNELNYARKKGKIIHFLEPEKEERMSKSSKDELIEYLAEAVDYWKREEICINEKIRGHEMHNQIVALIKKPEVTEEWIEAKATEAHDTFLTVPDDCDYKCIAMKIIKDFIRSLVE